MSQNINEQGWRVLAIVIVAAALAFTGGMIVGEHDDKYSPKLRPGVQYKHGQPEDIKPAAAVHYEIKPYTGVGSGVLESGTLLNLTGKDQYTEPADIVGHIEAPGTWALVRSDQ